jgi:hypothetical protein
MKVDFLVYEDKLFSRSRWYVIVRLENHRSAGNGMDSNRESMDKVHADNVVARQP